MKSINTDVFKNIETCKKIINLLLYEFINLGYGVQITKVIGGYIYSYDTSIFTSVHTSIIFIKDIINAEEIKNIKALNKIKELLLHETVRLSNSLNVKKVIGGYIYSMNYSICFVKDINY